MILALSYAGRALVLGFGVFFLVNAITGLLCTAVAVKWRGFGQMEAGQAARLLLALRLLPALIAIAVTAFVLVPGFLTLERQLGSEPVGLLISMLAAMGVAVWIESLARSLRAMVAVRTFSRAGVLETSELFLAIAGIWRPTIIASRGFLETIPAEQQAVAMRHEMAHFESKDNLKRLLILLAPAIFPLIRKGGFQKLEDAWQQYAERAADHQAVAGDPEQALLLAELLVRTARGRSVVHPALAIGLIGSPEGLTDRIERLLDRKDARSTQFWPGLALAILLTLPVAVVLLPARPLFELVERFLLHA